MNSTFHWADRVSLAPYTSDSDLYDIAVQYVDAASDQHFKLVHVPASLKAALMTGPVGFQLETLEINSAASKSLPGAPLFAIVAVQYERGQQVHCLPREWQSHRLRQQVWLILSCLAALLIVKSGGPSTGLLGVAVGAAGALVWASMRHSRVRPFVILLQLGKRH